MLNVPENELFSAYLDGELTVEEQAEVEQLLDASPAARQLLDELRALSTNLQSLPVYELKEDLSARVLRRAEQRVLCGSAELNPQGDAPASVRGATVRRAILRRVLRPRNLAWPAIAVVVALVLMVLDRGLPVDGQDEGQIAQKPDESSVANVETPTLGAQEPAPMPVAPRVSVSDQAAADVADARTTEKPASDRQNGSAEPSEADLPARPADTPEPASPIDRLLVVRCNVPARAVGKQTLGEIFAKRKIPRLETADRTTGKTYVEVELTPTQMRAVVADLKARSETFTNISVPPMPGASGPRIPSAAGTTRGMERPIQVTSAVPRNPSSEGKKNGLTGRGPSSGRTGSPSRSEPKIRVRFEFSVAEAQAEVKRKESDSAEKTDSRKSADDKDKE